MKNILTSLEWSQLNAFAIFDNTFAKNPRNDVCLSFNDFKEQFELIAYQNYNVVYKQLIGNKKNKVNISKLKKEAPIWRPNAIYGNRPNGTKTDRVIMGSGLYAFDIDFKDFWNFKEHQNKLEGYKEVLLRDCPNIFAVYKSFSMSGLHIIVQGVCVKDANSYRHMWEFERRRLKRDFKFIKVDEAAKDITRALYIGSDKNPLFKFGGDKPMILEYQNTVKTYLEEKHIQLPSDVDFEFAKIQCMIKPTFLKESRRRYIRFFTNYEDLDDKLKEKFKTIFHEVIGVKTGEDYPIDAYLLDTVAPIYLPRFYIGGDGFIPVGRRRTTLVSLLSKFIYLNGYWLCDNIPLVKKHFDKHYFERFEQRKNEQFSKEEMFSVIDSVLKQRLLPIEIDGRTRVNGVANKKQNMNKKNIFVDYNKSQLSSNQSSIITRKFNLYLKQKRVCKFILALYVRYGKNLTVKELYYKGESVWGYIGITSLSSLRQFIFRYKLDVSYLHIIKTFSNNTNKYVEVKHNTSHVTQK